MDTLAIFVTSEDEQLLSVPKITKSTVRLMCEAISDILEEWKIANQVKLVYLCRHNSF